MGFSLINHPFGGALFRRPPYSSRSSSNHMYYEMVVRLNWYVSLFHLPVVSPEICSFVPRNRSPLDLRWPFWGLIPSTILWKQKIPLTLTTSSLRCLLKSRIFSYFSLVELKNWLLQSPIGLPCLGRRSTSSESCAAMRWESACGNRPWLCREPYLFAWECLGFTSKLWI